MQTVSMQKEEFDCIMELAKCFRQDMKIIDAILPTDSIFTYTLKLTPYIKNCIRELPKVSQVKISYGLPTCHIFNDDGDGHCKQCLHVKRLHKRI